MRTVCLATPVEDPDRFARTQAHFAEVGLTDVAYFHGLHKDQSGLDTRHPYMVDRAPGTKDADVPYYMGPHPTNIWIGHYFLWQALKLSGDSHWLVLECDAKFPADGLRPIRHAMNAMSVVDPEYDLVYLGSCNCASRKKTLHRALGDGRDLAREGQETIVSGIYTIHGSGPQCNHAYVIAAKAVPTFESTLRKVWAPIDIQQTSECFEYGTVLPRSLPFERPTRPLKVYTVLPRLVDQWNTDIPL